MITTVIPVSPIPSHPDISILTETVESVRHHLPDSEIILTFDGIRAEQDHLREPYEHAIAAILWQADHVWKHCYPIIFDRHHHQTGMMRATLDRITTPLLMYVEADCPLVTDEPINWTDVTDPITSGTVDLVRFCHESLILPVYRHMMLGRQGNLELTCQWSQRPHVASTAFYRRVMDCFTPEARAFIEDRMHSVCHEAFKQDGVTGWYQWRLSVYAPPGGNIKRSLHLDGRAGAAKYDASQVF